MFFKFSNFKIIINQVFELQNEKRVVERELLILKQRKSTTIYASQFKTLSYKMSWNNAALTSHFYERLYDKIKDIIIAINKFDSLQNMINVAIRIDNRQHKKYVDKKINAKIHSTKKFFKEDSMKLNITKIKRLKIKICYSCEKKNHIKRNCSKKTMKTTKK